MKKYILALIAVLTIACTAQAQHVRVREHINHKTGTYVMPHYRSAPDHSRLNNWSARGNYNPYTGKRGTADPYRPRRHR